MSETDKTPIENPTAKEWFEPGYVRKPADPANVVRPGFGPALPPATDDDQSEPGETPPPVEPRR